MGARGGPRKEENYLELTEIIELARVSVQVSGERPLPIPQPKFVPHIVPILRQAI